MQSSELRAKCDQAAEAIATAPIEQWPGWALYLLERLDDILCGRYMDRERDRMLEQVECILQARVQQGRW
jgi:hypothetical protein